MSRRADRRRVEDLRARLLSESTQRALDVLDRATDLVERLERVGDVRDALMGLVPTRGERGTPYATRTTRGAYYRQEAGDLAQEHGVFTYDACAEDFAGLLDRWVTITRPLRTMADLEGTDGSATAHVDEGEVVEVRDAEDGVELLMADGSMVEIADGETYSVSVRTLAHQALRESMGAGVRGGPGVAMDHPAYAQPPTEPTLARPHDAQCESRYTGRSCQRLAGHDGPHYARGRDGHGTGWGDHEDDEAFAREQSGDLEP